MSNLFKGNVMSSKITGEHGVGIMTTKDEPS